MRKEFSTHRVEEYTENEQKSEKDFSFEAPPNVIHRSDRISGNVEFFYSRPPPPPPPHAPLSSAYCFFFLYRDFYLQSLGHLRGRASEVDKTNKNKEGLSFELSKTSKRSFGEVEGEILI